MYGKVTTGCSGRADVIGSKSTPAGSQVVVRFDSFRLHCAGAQAGSQGEEEASANLLASGSLRLARGGGGRGLFSANASFALALRNELNFSGPVSSRKVAREGKLCTKR